MFPLDQDGGGCGSTPCSCTESPRWADPTTYEVVLDFNSTFDKDAVGTAIDNAVHLQGKTWTDFALRSVRRHATAPLASNGGGCASVSRSVGCR